MIKEVEEDRLVFKFNGIKDNIVLCNKEVTIKNNTFTTLNNAVSFIEKTYPDVEQSIILPNKALTVEQFVL